MSCIYTYDVRLNGLSDHPALVVDFDLAD